jgi:hypothetical protein
LRDLPTESQVPSPPGEPPTTGQAEDAAGAPEASGSSGSSSRAATVRQRRWTAAAARPPDWELLETVHQATRALLYITSVREVTEILAAAVHRLGGQTTPASQADSWALPIDLSFGDGEPILPVAEPLTLVRMQLEQVLPGLVEDARRAVQLLRRSDDLDGYRHRAPVLCPNSGVDVGPYAGRRRRDPGGRRCSNRGSQPPR